MNAENELAILDGSAQVSVRVNGEPRILNPGDTVLDVVRCLGLEPARVAVELNGEIVRRDLWAGIRVDDGAQIEIVQFVGGG